MRKGFLRRLMPLGLAVVLLACGCRAGPEATPLPVALAPLLVEPFKRDLVSARLAARLKRELVKGFYATHGLTFALGWSF